MEHGTGNMYFKQTLFSILTTNKQICNIHYSKNDEQIILS